MLFYEKGLSMLRKDAFKSINNTLSNLGWNHYFHEQMNDDSNPDLNILLIDALLILNMGTSQLISFDKGTINSLLAFNLITKIPIYPVAEFKITSLGRAYLIHICKHPYFKRCLQCIWHLLIICLVIMVPFIALIAPIYYVVHSNIHISHDTEALFSIPTGILFVGLCLTSLASIIVMISNACPCPLLYNYRKKNNMKKDFIQYILTHNKNNNLSLDNKYHYEKSLFQNYMFLDYPIKFTLGYAFDPMYLKMIIREIVIGDPNI